MPHEEVRQGFKHINPIASQIIDHGRYWKSWVLCDREPSDVWVDGRVTLLGDAAHPMLQYFPQGACMALEDAVCLADVMERQEGKVEIAFGNYKKDDISEPLRCSLCRGSLAITSVKTLELMQICAIEHRVLNRNTIGATR